MMATMCLASVQREPREGLKRNQSRALPLPRRGELSRRHCPIDDPPLTRQRGWQESRTRENRVYGWNGTPRRAYLTLRSNSPSSLRVQQYIRAALGTPRRSLVCAQTALTIPDPRVFIQPVGALSQLPHWHGPKCLGAAEVT